ncbi:hypothetical protein [Kutzneria chonburiensis]|uniref:Uncharacterized protein n=1 Tax=Kutzneria chonburiensis TaxID=1483604 RepID=A0ABV6MZT5_9PSEU|nr:hypothetical protein [Kutzneria chonburiensis]
MMFAVTANTADGTDPRLRPDLVPRSGRCLSDPPPAHVGAVTAAQIPLLAD